MSARTAGLVLGWISCFAFSWLASPALSQIATDGTLGPRVELAGPDYGIGAELGRRAGGNLFHSFERFDLRTLENGTIEGATFSGPPDIATVISRVTGGERSDIDGTLRSTIPGADFFFINPAGVVFGPNASLDVQGSFHVSTADELRFSDGAVFSATNPDASSLTVAAPEAFGFLGAQPAAITVDRSALAVLPGEALSLSGGELTVTGDPNLVERAPDGTLLFGSFLLASDGRIVLASLGEGGTLMPASGVATGATGKVVIKDAAFVGTSGADGGAMMIAGGDIAIDRSILIATNFGAQPAGGGIELQAAGDLHVSDSRVVTGTDGIGRAGDIDVHAGRLVLDGAQLDASTFGVGPSGTVTIDAIGRVDVSGKPEGLLFGTGSFVRAGVFSNGRGDGSGGRIEIAAPTLVMADGALLDAGTFGSASAGSIELKLDLLELAGGAQVLVATEGAGAAGELTIAATDAIEISGPNTLNPRGVNPARDRSGFLASSGFLFSGSGALGDAGTIRVETPVLQLDDLAVIEAGTWTAGAGRSGTIEIDAGSVDVAGGSQIANSARSVGAAAGGDLRIAAADRIRIRGTGIVGGGELRSGVFGDALGSPVGDLVLETSNLIVNGGRITSDTTSDADAGVIRISAPDGDRVALVIRNEGQIFAGTDGGGDGADIIIEDGGTIEITGTSSAELATPDVNPTSPTGIFSNVKRNGEGNGGDIRIVAEGLEMRQGAAISSQTLGEGAAGAIDIALGDRATIDDSVIETAVAAISDAPTAGGQIQIRGGRLIDLTRARITTNGVVPAPDASILTLSAPIVAINRSTVTSLTAAGEPLPGVRSGVVVIDGDPTLISSDSLVAATSSVELRGVDEELGTKLVVLPGAFLDAASQLRERCAARRDVGASSFTGVGRGGLPPGPDQPLMSDYLAGPARGDEAGSAGSGEAEVALPGAPTGKVGVALAPVLLVQACAGAL